MPCPVQENVEKGSRFPFSLMVGTDLTNSAVRIGRFRVTARARRRCRARPVSSRVELVGDHTQQGRDLGRLSAVGAAPLAITAGEAFRELDEILGDDDHLIGFFPACLDHRVLGVQQLHLEGLGTLAPLGHPERDPLSRTQRGGSGGQGGGMHEHLTAIVAREETETLVSVVPLDLAGGHWVTSCFQSREPRDRNLGRPDRGVPLVPWAVPLVSVSTLPGYRQGVSGRESATPLQTTPDMETRPGYGASGPRVDDARDHRWLRSQGT